jgi:hypothetical protein
MTDEDYDELSTKRDMVRLLANDASAEQLDAAMHACIDTRLNDAERRTVLIEAIYTSWCERLAKKPRPPGVDVTATQEDIRRMFLDIHAAVGAPRPPQSRSLGENSECQDMGPTARLSVVVAEPLPQPAPWGETSGVTTPIRARLSSDWARARWLDREFRRSAV